MRECYGSFRKGLFRPFKVFNVSVLTVIHLTILVGPAFYSGIPRRTNKGDHQIPSDARQANKDKIHRSRVIYN